MNESDRFAVDGINRSFRLTITDIERLRLLQNLSDTTKQRLTSLEKNPDKNAGNIIQEKTVLYASKKAAHELERLMLFYEDQ